MAAVELVREIFHFDNSVRNKQKREALHQQANALLADTTEAPAKKGKKKIKDEEPEAGLAESTDSAPPSGGLSIHLPKLKPKRKKPQLPHQQEGHARSCLQGNARKGEQDLFWSCHGGTSAETSQKEGFHKMRENLNSRVLPHCFSSLKPLRSSSKKSSLAIICPVCECRSMLS